MSVFTAEAARAERATMTLKDLPVEILDACTPNGIHDGYPVSGDMLAVITRDDLTRRAVRRILANTIPEGVTP